MDGMRLAAAIIETLWGVALPVDQLIPLACHCGHACLDALSRWGR